MTATTAALPPTPATWRTRAWPGRLFDLAIVAGLLLVGGLVVASSTHEIPHLGLVRAPWYLVVAVPLAALLLRRRFPLATLGVILAALLVEALLRSPILVQPLVLVGVYTVAARVPWRLSLPLTAFTVAVFVTGTSVSRGELTFPELITALIPIGAAYVVGIYVGTRTAYVDALQARALQLARERELLAQTAVAEERVRIARELHDVVAHHLSLITVQAAALQTQLSPDHPGHELAGSMARGGRQAMDEMRRMLGLLRPDSAEAPERSPQPGLDEVPALVEQARAAGLDVELFIDAHHPPVPAGVDLSAYRIVQEALTNVMRHAGPARCRVHLRVESDALRLRITDDGRGGAEAQRDTPGHGLAGMRERVALFGGELFAGPVPGGGFAVQATLPLVVAGDER
ncbi:MAG TPA: sensor histidine kinase [Candidatus Dormibacteraeota bacterium]|jgi:signal transduction histidine kinase|nr:sensor histidine kinase [Candidatus Dormibacteraeota bacterium]